MNTSIYLQLISLNKNHNKHYLKRYVKLASFYKQRNWSYKSGLHHEHHIVPDSFGGPDTNENLICITPREHFILHHLLYKAFPKSSMTTAFKSMCSGWGHMNFRVTSKVYQNAMLEFAERHRETSRKMQNKKVAEGKHHWLGGEFQRKSANKRIEDGTHPFCNIEFQRQTQNKLVKEGKHRFCDSEFQRQTQRKRVAEGTHPFCGGEIQRKLLENGTHPLLNKNQQRIKCQHCNRIFNKGNFARWHGDKCKLKPQI